MKKNNYLKNAFVTKLLLTFLISKSAFSAQESGPTAKDAEKKSFKLSVGLGIALKNNIRKDNNNSGTGGDIVFSPIPLIQFAWGPISLGAQGLNASVYGNRQMGVFFNLNSMGDRYNGSGMDDRENSWFLGAGFRFHKLSFLYSHDLQGRSHGKKITLHYTEMYPIGTKFFTRSAVGAECYNRSYADYYFGVKASEVTTTRSEYHTGGYCIPAVSFFPGYKYDENISFLTGLSLKGIPKEIRRSPTTTGTWLETAIILGGIWQF